jgi:hypothetical protein
VGFVVFACHTRPHVLPGELLAIAALFIRRTVCCLFLLQLGGFFWFPIDTEMVDFQPDPHNFQEFMPC